MIGLAALDGGLLGAVVGAATILGPAGLAARRARRERDRADLAYWIDLDDRGWPWLDEHDHDGPEDGALLAPLEGQAP